MNNLLLFPILTINFFILPYLSLSLKQINSKFASVFVFNIISNSMKILKKFRTKKKRIIDLKGSLDVLPITNKLDFSLAHLENQIKLLYIDVLSRGFHPTISVKVNKQLLSYEKDRSSQKNKLQITTIQALNTIWRCVARQIGDSIADANYLQTQINLVWIQLSKIDEDENLMLQQTSFNNAQLNLKLKYKQLNKSLTQNKINLKKSAQQLISENSGKQYIQIKKNSLNILQDIIIGIERQLFLKTLVGIKDEESSVELILQQCYPPILVPKQIAIQVLGIQIFSQKCQFYHNHWKQRFLTPENERQIISCHRCLKIIEENPYPCNNNNAIKNVGSTLLIDPYHYYERMIHENVEVQQILSKQSFVHSYLKYYRPQNYTKYVCNRQFCTKCKFMQQKFEPVMICQFCQGLCKCIRCSNVQLMVKLMGIYIQYGGNLEQFTENKFLFTAIVQSMRLNMPNSNYKQISDRNYDANLIIKAFRQKKIFLPIRDRKVKSILYFPAKLNAQTFVPINYKPPMRVRLSVRDLEQQLRKQARETARKSRRARRQYDLVKKQKQKQEKELENKDKKDENNKIDEQRKAIEKIKIDSDIQQHEKGGIFFEEQES